MSYTDVDICNDALAHLGRRTIETLVEATAEAQHCNRVYGKSRRAVLADSAWSFAHKQVALAEVTGETVEGWSYVYAWPSDCIVPRTIYNASNASTGTSYDYDTDRYVQTGRIEFKVVVNSDGNARLIVTNQEDAILEYTANITATAIFSDQFIEALAYKIAAELAIPLTRSEDLHKNMIALYSRVLPQAQAVDARAAFVLPTEGNSFVDARG